MPVGTFTEGAQLIPANTVALLLRACGPRNDAMDESGTGEDSSDLDCADGNDADTYSCLIRVGAGPHR